MINGRVEQTIFSPLPQILIFLDLLSFYVQPFLVNDVVPNLG